MKDLCCGIKNQPESPLHVSVLPDGEIAWWTKENYAKFKTIRKPSPPAQNWSLVIFRNEKCAFEVNFFSQVLISLWSGRVTFCRIAELDDFSVRPHPIAMSFSGSWWRLLAKGKHKVFMLFCFRLAADAKWTIPMSFSIATLPSPKPGWNATDAILMSCTL